MDEQYTKQVALLLRIIPELNKMPALAMHGGTAIEFSSRKGEAYRVN